VAAAEARVAAAEARAKAAQIDLKLYQKAVAFEERQEAAARKLASKTAVADKTADLVPQYDPIVSTESLYKDTPLSALQYDTKTKPKVQDSILVIAGPDKGRAGVLLAIEKESAIIKLDSRELKVLDFVKIAKQL